MNVSQTSISAVPLARPATPPAVRARRMLAVGVILLSAALGLPRFLTHSPFSRFGVQLDWTHPNEPGRVSKVLAPPSLGLLREGDKILSAAGEPFTQQNIRERQRQGGWPRGPMPIEIERGDQRLRLTLPPVRLTAWQRVRVYTWQLAAMVSVPLVAFLLVWRRPDLGTAWTFLAFACLQGVSAIYQIFRFPQTEPAAPFRLYLDAYHALTFWTPAVFLHFMTVFPRPRWSRRTAVRSVWFWLVVLSYVLAPMLFPAATLAGAKADDLYVWFDVICFTLGTVSLLERFARPARPDWQPAWNERALAMGVAITLLASTVLEVLDAIGPEPWLVAMTTLPALRVVLTVLTLAWLASPLVIAYLIANDPAFDPRRLLVRSFPYALLSGVLAALYLAIVLVAQRLFAAATGEQAMAFNVLAALVVAFAFAPLRGRVQLTLDRIFGRDPHALRRSLDQAGHELLGALDPDEVRASVERGLERGLKRHVALEWSAAGPPRALDPEEVPDGARPAVNNLLVQAGVRLENLALQAHRAAAERREVELREAAARAELRALQAQVQPHFLFNALNALSCLTETDPRAAQRFTERLADMLRYTVEASERPAALLADEIGFVEDYLGVARERYENPLCFEYRGAPELLGTVVPPLLLQPLVENSLKHGCAPDSPALHLVLEAHCENGWMTLEFADDGSCNGNGSPGLGVGLQNLEQRMRRFAGPGTRMTAGRRPGGGFAVTLSWPMDRGGER
jgi:hypothetical protein